MLSALFYRFYRRNALARARFRGRVSTAGRFVVVAMALAAFIGADTNSTLHHQIFCLLAGAVVVALLHTWGGYRGRLRARRFPPRFVSAGDPVRYEIEVENRGRWTLRGVRLVEDVPDPVPTADEFRHRREPGEENRNLFDRTTAYYRWLWLINRKRLLEVRESDPVTVRPGERRRVRLWMLPLKRGVISLGNLRALQADVLGLFYRPRRIELDQQSVIVLPRRYRLPDLDLEGRTRRESGGLAASHALGQSDEFFGLRDYRPGDPLRHVHWRTWARLRQPVVKEFENESFPRYGLVLDTFIGRESEEVFEEAVSLAASFAVTVDTRESMLELLFVGENAYRFSAGGPGGGPATEKMLEILAGVQPLPREEDFQRLKKHVLRRLGDMAVCVFVFLKWDPARESLVRDVRSAGIACLPLVVVDEEEPAPHPEVCQLRAGRIQEDVWRLEDYA